MTHDKIRQSAAGVAGVHEHDSGDRVNTGVRASDLQTHSELRGLAPVFRELDELHDRPTPNWKVLNEELRRELSEPASRTWRMRYRTVRDSLKATDSPLLRAGAAVGAAVIVVVVLLLLWLAASVVLTPATAAVVAVASAAVVRVG